MAAPDQVISYFVRHGSTELNDQGKFRGPLDPPLDDNGLQDAHKLSAFFADKPVDSVWSSDRKRAQQTASAILQPQGLTYTPDENLRAWNVGYLAGEKKDEHQDEIKYFQSNPDVQIPNGESLQQFRDRVTPSILKAIRTGMQSGKPSMVIAHSSIIHELGNIIHNDHESTNVRPGGVAAVYMHNGQLRAKPIVRPDKDGSQYGT